jgi:hypothetical protein
MKVAMRLRGKLLRTPPAWRILGRRPMLLGGVAAMEGAVMSARSVPFHLKGLAELRASSLIGCPW